VKVTLLGYEIEREESVVPRHEQNYAFRVGESRTLTDSFDYCSQSQSIELNRVSMNMFSMVMHEVAFRRERDREGKRQFSE
jgi:hypothetical protein